VTPLLGYFVIREMRLANIYRRPIPNLKFLFSPVPNLRKIYPFTKFEVSIFIRSKDMAQVPCNGWISPDTDTEYRGISKYDTDTEVGIPNIEKYRIPKKNTEKKR